MPDVSVNLPLNAGVSGTYLLFLYNGATLINAGGDTLTESSNGFFTATVAETLAADTIYRADVTRNGSVIYSGFSSGGNVVDIPLVGLTANAILAVTAATSVGIASGNNPGAAENKLEVFQGEKKAVTITALQSDGVTPLDLSGLTLELVFETHDGNFLAVIPNASITISGDSNNIFGFTYPEIVTSEVRIVTWTLRLANSTSEVKLNGTLKVKRAAVNTSS